jgi:hypothetical protein
VIGRILINADEQVAVTSTAGPGTESRAHSGIGHLNDIVALTSRGGAGGSLRGTSGTDTKSGANDGIQDSAGDIQVIVNRDGTRGVSLAKNGVADTIQSVSARRTATPINNSTANPSFFDVNGNPEFILDASGNLVANTGANAALRSAANNVARFGRVVGTYDAGVDMARVQYVDINNDGRPDVVAAVLSKASALTLIDADNNNVYDQISGRVRLPNGDLAALALVDYVYATGRTAAVAGNKLDWTYADFSTANGGRGGDARIATGLTRTSLASTPMISLNAGKANTGAPAADANFSLLVSSTMQATPLSAGSNNVASARIGVTDYLYAATDASYNAKLAGALHASAQGGANGGGAGINAVNANGGRSGEATVVSGGVAGDIAINLDAPKTRGVKVSSFSDDVTSGNRSIAAIGHGGQSFAKAANGGGSGASDSGNGSLITESANGGRGGNALIQIGEVKGAITVRAGSAEAGGDFALVIEAIKGGATAVGDDDDITFANIGHGGLLDATGGNGGSADDGQYQANGGAGGSAVIQTAAVSGDITLDAFTYADAAFGNGVRIEASTLEGGAQKVRAQAGHYAWANANGGSGGAGTGQSEITEQFNQQANGGAGGLASIKLAGFAGAIVIDAGPAKNGDDAIVIKSSDNTVNSGANNYLLAAAGHGAWVQATGSSGGASGQRDAKGGLTLTADPAFHEGFDVPGAAGSTAPKDRNPIMFGTVRDGGAGGWGTVEIGDTSGAVTLTAHDLSGGGKDGIFISSLVGDGANTGSSLLGNLAIVGHNHNASARGGAGGSSISSTLGATVTSGDGGHGGAGKVVFGAISGDLTLTNVVAGEANKTGGALDKNIRILASDQDATDSADHRATARVGHRTLGDAFGGAGGNAALPPPGPMYSATLSAQGGFGGAATITSAAITGNISITAENSVLIEALNPTVSSPTVVAGVGHHAIANAVVAGAGGFGGLSASFNDAAMLTALRRFVDLGQDFSKLSDLEKELVAPVLRYYKLAAVYDGSAGPAASRLPGGFVSRILAGPAAFVAGTPNAYPLARDIDAIAGTDNSVPEVSANEKNTLVALSIASGHGGGAYVTQGAITGDVSVVANSANTADAARGILLSTLGVLNGGTQIAHIGHESEVSNASGGKGQNVWGGTNAEGIGGDGGEVRIVQQLVSGAISLTAGSSVLVTYGDIVVKASGTETAGWQRSLIGHRATVGSDDPGFRSAPVARAGDGGGDQNALANGKLGNGGAVAITQDGAAGAITLTAEGPSPSGTSITVLSTATLASGEALASIGHALVIDSVKAGDAIPYTVGPDTRASLYGVREGNGGSVSISQGPISDAIMLDADGKLLIESQTADASGRATTVIGHKQIVADTVYGTRSGTVIAGAGADVKDVEDIDVANGAPDFTNGIHANHVQDADGGNVIINVGAVTANIMLQSRRGDVDVLANGNTGKTTTTVGHQRFVTALTGQGGVTGGPSGPRSPGEGGGADITRGAVSGDILIQALAARTVTVKTTSALGADAQVLVGHTVEYAITTGRSGYGAAAFAALDTALADFLALPASGAGQATTRDSAVVIHDLENVVAALTIANRYAEHYSATQRTDLSKALADATKALADARAATTIAGVRAAVTAAKTALALGNMTVIAGGNANGIADAADGGSIVYRGDAAVSGNITARAGVPATEGGKYLAGGVVAVQAENGDGALSFVELGHRHKMTNKTGDGAGLTDGSSLSGGVAGDGGSIKVSQTTTGDVSLIANRVVVNPTSGDGASVVHLLHTVAMTNTAGKADIEDLLGRGGAIDATQTATGTAHIRANEISSSPTGAADGLLMADGGKGASRLHIGITADVTNASGSDEMIAGKGGPDNNRGGAITTAQTVTSAFNINLDLNGTGNRADLIIRSVGEGAKSVEIGARVTQTSRSGHPVDDGSNVTATQTVAGDFLTSGLEDLVVENNGLGSATVHLGHAVVQTADSGETAGETPQDGGITTATQNVSGAITLQSSRSFTQQTDATATGLNHIGHSSVQTARSADRRLGLTPEDYPLVAAPGFNVVARQTVQANLSVSSGEILVQSLNGLPEGVRLGNTASVVVDTHGGGRVSSNQTLGGNISLTTVAALPQQSSIVTTPVNGDIRVLTPSKAGAAQVGHSSTSKVSHNPAAYQPTGVFVTSQNIVDAITVASLRNIEVREGDGGVARIGHTIVETGALSKTDAVKTSSADPSTVAQSIDSDIAVTAGNSLGMVTDSGTAQIGHYSPPSNEWQVTGGRVVTPQKIGGDITVKVGLNATPTVVGQAPAPGALGTNNALLDGTAGGEVRIGHKFAPVEGAALNEVQTASGDIWVEVGAHLHAKTANIGHGPYDFAAASVSKNNAVMGAGATRNRIAGLTTIGAGQNTPSPEDATTEKDLMLFAGANINSGYGENGGELRFFMPSRRNLTIVAGDKIPVTQFNDSASKTDAIPARSDSTDIVQGAVTHENGFTTMSAAARYVDTGPGNFAFYFGGEDVGPVYIAGPWDYTHRIDRPGGSCINVRGGGVNIGAAVAARPRNALAWSGPLSGGDDGEGCGAQAPAGRAESGNAFIPARMLTGGGQPGPRADLPPAAAPIIAGEPRVGETIVIRTAAPAPLAAPVTFGSPDVHAPATPRPIPLQAVRVSGERVLSFSSSGANLVARISPR